MNKNNKIQRAALSLSIAMASHASAMQALDDGALAGVSGRDGLTLNISSPQVQASSIALCVDAASGCALTGTDSSKLAMSGVSLRRVGMNGANPGVGNVNINTTLDAYGNGVTSAGGIALVSQWDRMRLQVNQLLHGNITQSSGSFALDASGRFELINVNGLNSGQPTAKLYLALNDADFFYRQGTAAGSPELLLNNLDFLWDMPQGVVGVDSNGILIEGDVNFNLTFDLRYEGTPTSTYTVGTEAQDIPVIRYGWTGGLDDARVRIGSGGSWLGVGVGGDPNTQIFDRNTKSQGLNMAIRWNYKPDFKWVIGEATGDRAGLEFGNWVNLPNTAQIPTQPAPTTYGFDFPSITLDMLRAGRGPGGLCWGANWDGPSTACQAPVHGGQFLNIAPEDHSLAFILRDGFLRAYSTSVRIIDPPNADENFSWALIYTLGNIDANIYLRPDTRTASSTGIKADILMMSQTFDVFDEDGDGNTWEQGANWGYGSHFMIGDTDASLGIGILNASILLAGDNQYIKMLPAGIKIGDVSETASPVRLGFRGRFGGGDIPAMNELISIADMDANFEFDRFEFMIKPPSGGETYLGYEATVRFANLNTGFAKQTAGDASDDGSYFSLAEPGRANTDFRLADATGWLAARNGRIQIKPDSETPVGVPAQLVIENDLLVGASVPGALATDAFKINRVEFGDRNLGSIVVPSGQWYSKLVLQQK